MSKNWESIFDPSKKVDAANFITEIIISNYLKWQKKPLPRSPFWQKAISEKSDVLKDLRTRYAAEVSMVKDLLRVFHFAVVAKFVKKTGVVGIRMVKAETRERMLAKLVVEAIGYAKEGDITPTVITEAMALPDFISTQKFSTSEGNSALAEL